MKAKKLSILLLLLALGITTVQNLLQAQAGIETPEQALERELEEYGKQLKQLYNFDNPIHLQTLKGHSKSINSVAFSPDGQYIASGSGDKTVKIWKRSGGSFSLCQTLKGHSYGVYSVAFSPDGQYIASGGWDVKIWKQSGGSFSLCQTLKGHSRYSQWVEAVAFSPDGQYIASGSGDKTVKIWKQSGGSFSLCQTLKGHFKWVNSVAFSPDGQYFACGTGKYKSDNYIEIYKINEKALHEEFALFKIKREAFVQYEKERGDALAQIQNTFNPKDEFETEQEYKVRLKKGENEKKAIEEKYKLRFNEELISFHEELALLKRKKEAFIQTKIRKSREEVVLNIKNVGQYNSEKEILPITINNITEDVKIPRSSARSFKENWQKTKVVGLKQLTKNLLTYEFFNINIIHPITSSRYPFGEHRALDGVQPEGISVAQDVTVIPPEFKISAKLKEPSGNGFLDAEEKGEIVVTVDNIGKGAAFGLIFDIRADKNDPALIYSQTRIPGEIQPGKSKTVTFDISADKSIKRNLRVFTITALESNGFNPDPVKISFETYPLQLAELSLVDFGINTASGDNVIVPGEVVDIKARVQNIGEGKAKDIKFSVNPPRNVFFAPGSKQKFNFSELDIGEFVDFEFSILTNKQVKDEVVISIGAAEKYAQKSFSLPLEINKPLQSVQEFVVKGKEREKLKIQNVATLSIDIAKDIPRTNADKKDAFAVVIGNRDYLKVQNVDYAISDATLMKEYLIKSLGYRDENIFFIKNATKADFELYFGTKGTHKGKLYNSVRPDGQSEVFVYYSGHGSPDIETGKGYFVPVDADPMYVSLSGFPTDLLYENLAKVPTKNVTVVLDACFSGSGLLKNISPVRIKFDNTVAKVKNSVVFSSSTGDQVSSWYPEKQHGMFTYFFLKGIHNKNADSNRDGKVTYNELFKFVTDRNEGVPRYARQLHNVDQMPTFWGDKAKVFVEY